MSSLVVILLVLLVLALFGGLYGIGPGGFGYVSLSPLGVIILIVVILWVAGYLR